MNCNQSPAYETSFTYLVVPCEALVQRHGVVPDVRLLRRREVVLELVDLNLLLQQRLDLDLRRGVWTSCW